mgnify:FL=1
MKTIAVIEDDQHIGNIIENALKKEGYETLRAYSGTEAVYLLSHNIPDLILLDLMLPGLAGEEILPKMDGIPVIVVSAKVGIDDKVNLLLSGAVDYITKPFEIRELLVGMEVERATVQVTSRKGRVSRNRSKSNRRALTVVTSRKGRVSRNWNAGYYS